MMFRKLQYVALCFAISSLMSACTDNTGKAAENDKNKLDASFVKNAHTADGLKDDVVDLLPTLDFTDDTFYNFGSMHEGESASHPFHFVNNGKAPLLITSAAGSCGCTVPDYPREPIAPGQRAVINVKFNSAGKVGHQNKTVNIFTNSNKGVHYLSIEADVTE